MDGDRVSVMALVNELGTNLGVIRQKATSLKLGKMIDMSYTSEDAEAIRQAILADGAKAMPDEPAQPPGEYVQLNVKVPDTLIVELKQIEAQVYAMKLKQGKRAYASRAEILSMALGSLRRELAQGNPRANIQD